MKQTQSKLVLAASMMAMVSVPGMPEIPPGLFQKGLEKPVGLRERIAQANTEGEITMLMAEGKEYAMASEKTRKSWKRTAIRRQVQLNREKSKTRQRHDSRGGLNISRPQARRVS